MCLKTRIIGDKGVEALKLIGKVNSYYYSIDARDNDRFQDVFSASPCYHIAAEDITCYKILRRTKDGTFWSPYVDNKLQYLLGEDKIGGKYINKSDEPVKASRVVSTLDKDTCEIEITHGLHVYTADSLDYAIGTVHRGIEQMVCEVLQGISENYIKEFCEEHRDDVLEIHCATIPAGTVYVEGFTNGYIPSYAAEQLRVSPKVMHSEPYFTEGFKFMYLK